MIADTSSQDQTLAPQRKRFPWRLLVMAAGAAVVMVVCMPTVSRWYDSVPSIQREQVQVNPVIRGDLVRDIAVTGRLVAANAPQVYSSEAGVVEMRVNPGDSVTKGQVVAEVVSPELNALIQQQRARVNRLTLEAKRGDLSDQEAQLDLQRQLDEAEVALNAAKREFDRSERSYEKNIISQSLWAKARDALQEAKLLHQHAVEKIAIAKRRLSFERDNRLGAIQEQQYALDELNRRQQGLAVTSPVSGLVGNWSIQQREQVAAATPLMTIVDLSQYDAELKVPEFYADDLGLGLSVMLQIGGEVVAANITSVSPEIKQNVVQVKARITQAITATLRQNQRINARIEFEKKSNVLMVKRGLFLTTGQGHSFKVNEDNSAEKVMITTGIQSTEYIEITSGLSEHNRIVTSSYEDFIEQPTIQLVN